MVGMSSAVIIHPNVVSCLCRVTASTPMRSELRSMVWSALSDRCGMESVGGLTKLDASRKKRPTLLHT